MYRPDPELDILAVPVGIYTMDTLLARLSALIQEPGCALAVGVNAHVINLTYLNHTFFKALIKAEVIYTDGASLQLAARLLRARLPEKLTTTDVWPHMCELAVQQGWRFFLLGGEPGLAERAAERAIQKYPGLNIVGTHHGYFDMRDPAIAQLINLARPDVLWVGMGDPRQALWADAWRSRLHVPLILTCGGMFKIVAGELNRISPFWRRHGLEWLYRMYQEPRTWARYLVGLPIFGARVILSLFFRPRTLTRMLGEQ